MRRFAYLPVFQVLDLGGVVAVSLAVAQHLESGHADGVHHGAAVGEELHIPHLQHAAVVGEAFEVVGDAHAELFGARLHGASDHEAVAWLEHVQGAGDGGEGHGAHEDGHFLVEAVGEAVVC